MKQKPNFLLILTDQQRYDTIHATGNPFIKTPNLDRLANEGCVFTNAYSPNPVCQPARHYLLTGTTARYHGYFENVHMPIKDDGLPTIARVLSDNGYTTAAVGKMHFTPWREHHGFNEMHLMEEFPGFKEEDAYLQYLHDNGLGNVRNVHGVRPYVYHYPQRSLVSDEHHGTSFVAKKSCEFITQNKKRPFFLMCGWIKPHPPWNIPDEWQGLYNDTEIPGPIPTSREFPYYTKESDWFGDNDSDELKERIRKAYYTSVSMVDKNIGILLDCLEKEGLLDNTCIIFTSDHGEMLQDKGFYQKGLPFESSARIPFMIRYPKRYSKKCKEDAFIDLMDIFPTILDEAGIDFHYKASDKKYSLVGSSLFSKGLGKRNRKYMFADYSVGIDRWVMIRDKQYKYIYFYDGAIEHMYDLVNDPGELENLVSRKKVPVKAYKALKKKCIEMEKKWGPEGYVKNNKFISFKKKGITPLSIDSYGKYPIWANWQFQTFGEKTPSEEAAIYAREIKEAMSIYSDKDILKKLSPGKEWDDDWFEKYKELGGDEKNRDDIFS
ncbi:sulfatase [Spirochaetota bacterium]